ncbi:MHC class I-like protein MILL1 [Lemmus lemmus]
MMLSLEPRTLLLAQLLLVLLIQQDLLGICVGPHTLHYFMSLHLVRSGETQLTAHGYIDGDLFLRYKGDRRRAEALRARIKGHAGAETWARETEGLRKMEEQLRRILAEVTGQDRGGPGLHTIQVTVGCELQRNGNIGGFWHLGFDGQDALTFDQKTLTWTMAVPSTQQTKTFWETHAPRADQVKTFLEDICPAQLQRHLNSLRNSQMDTGPPRVNVTSRRYPVGRITLTCWAFNLYPPVATLSWLQDGKAVQQHTFGPGTILPSGDGTYQTRLSIWVLPGQEPHFTCHLRHRSSNIEAPSVLGEKIGQSSTLGRGMQGRTDGATSSAPALVASALCSLLVLLASS